MVLLNSRSIFTSSSSISSLATAFTTAFTTASSIDDFSTAGVSTTGVSTTGVSTFLDTLLDFFPLPLEVLVLDADLDLDADFGALVLRLVFLDTLVFICVSSLKVVH